MKRMKIKEKLNRAYVIVYPIVAIIALGKLRYVLEQYVDKTYKMYPYVPLYTVGAAVFVALSNFFITKYTVKKQTVIRRVIFLIWAILGSVLYILPVLCQAPGRWAGLMKLISYSQNYLLFIVITYFANIFVRTSNIISIEC